jgi:hypothetical protein
MAHSLVRAAQRRGTTQRGSITDVKNFDAPAPLGETHRQVIDSFRQGDVVTIDGLPVLGSDAVWFCRTPYGAVLLTQTCDAVREEKPTVALAPIARLDGSTASAARDGKLLRYIDVPSAGPDAFADLAVIATIDKALFATLPRKAGVDQTDDDAVRKFGRAVGRRFGRFPFPDEVVPWLRPLEVVMQSKHDKNSPEGAAMRDVIELRVEAIGGWRNPPYALTLCVIVKPGVVPSFPDDEQPPCPDDLTAWLRTDKGDLRQASSAIANKLAMERTRSPSSASAYWLWLSLAEAWAARCTPDVGKRSPEDAAKILTAVTGIDAILSMRPDLTYIVIVAANSSTSITFRLRSLCSHRPPEVDWLPLFNLITTICRSSRIVQPSRAAVTISDDDCRRSARRRRNGQLWDTITMGLVLDEYSPGSGLADAEVIR